MRIELINFEKVELGDTPENSSVRSLCSLSAIVRSIVLIFCGSNKNIFIWIFFLYQSKYVVYLIIKL